MSYEPTNWKDGDLVTSAKLNKIEQGIAAGGGVLIVHDEDGTLDKTWQEIYDADVCVIIKIIDDYKYRGYIYETSIEGPNYVVTEPRSGVAYYTDSPESYPAKQTGGD